MKASFVAVLIILALHHWIVIDLQPCTRLHTCRHTSIEANLYKRLHFIGCCLFPTVACKKDSVERRFACSYLFVAAV